MKIAYHLPEKRVGNADLIDFRPEWTEEKIFSKTGILIRHEAGIGEGVLDLAEGACVKLFADGVNSTAVDFILFCTQSPEYVLPGCAGILQHRLGLPTSIGALDYNLGCSGFVYGLAVAKGLVVSGAARGILLVTSETYSKHIAKDDASSRAVFGDAAAAVFIDKDVVAGVGEFVFGTNGGGARMLAVEKGKPLFMDGPGIFNFALDTVPMAIEEVCNKNGIGIADVDLFVFHQANKFMLDTLRKICRLPEDKFYVDMEDTGNTVSSTIPIALKRAEEKNVLRKGMTIVTVGFGVGLSWAAAVVKW